jgi:hypothetical protein
MNSRKSNHEIINKCFSGVWERGVNRNPEFMPTELRPKLRGEAARGAAWQNY